MDWHSTQQAIQVCRRCEAECVQYLNVPRGEKRSPPWQPARPVRLYFVSVAPPWGGAYFWDETQRDAVRERLFAALREPLGVPITSCQQFRDLHLFLTPAVKCPSSKEDKDHQPLRAAIRHCASFLRDELLDAEPERILALGRVPFRGVCKMFGVDVPRTVAQSRARVTWVRMGTREVPLLGTYFVGNNRHGKFPAIVEDIARLLELKPRCTNG